MIKMINNYKKALSMLEIRLNELSDMRKALEAAGEDYRISELDLDRRISLLKTELGETKEIIAHLSSVVRRRELSVKT